MTNNFEQKIYLKRDRQPGSGDFLLPEAFVIYALPKLSGSAVKLYLYLSLASQTGDQMPGQGQILRDLALDLPAYKQAVNQLIQNSLLRLEAGNYYLPDLRLGRPNNSEEASESAAVAESQEIGSAVFAGNEVGTGNREDQANAELEDAIKQINDNFFQGVMPTSLYHTIDQWFSQYHFSPHVVYAIFSEAEQNGAGNSGAYLRAIADNWHYQGIKTYSDLNKYLARRQGLMTTAEMVRKKLNLRGQLTRYQEQLVEKWTGQWGFTDQLIDQALSMTVKISNPNLDYVDKVLTTWHEAGVKDQASLDQYHKHWDERKQHKSNRSQAATVRRSQNFAGRSDSSYKDLNSRRWLRQDSENGET